MEAPRDCKRSRTQQGSNQRAELLLEIPAALQYRTLQASVSQFHPYARHGSMTRGPDVQLEMLSHGLESSKMQLGPKQQALRAWRICSDFADSTLSPGHEVKDCAALNTRQPFCNCSPSNSPLLPALSQPKLWHECQMQI